ncbi:MAG: response regulator [Candidatus Electrothrix aestuarii]|uniref:Response regulator n=1 Tax=Candidatus Electrothrix aestuarii TaxID=3062594 RepID=A0AAU8M2W2_9BACT|nr:response regulator [Candidatus Electrothrix aestuarii]
MSGLDSYEATRQIRKLKNGQDVIIIALTAQTFGKERKKALNAGCDDFISKPYREEELFVLMRKHLDIQFLYQNKGIQEFDSDGGDTKEDLEPQGIDALPEGIRNTLLEATVNLNQEAFFSALEKLPPLHEKIATSLRALVENYQFEEVERILGRKK